MSKKTLRRAAAAAMLVSVAAAGGAAGAQAPPTDASDMGILVEAPRVLPPPPERSPHSGAAVVTTTIKISAQYGDLDLSRPADADRLMMRIARVARDACGYLDRLYPLNPDTDCVDRAIARATPAANAIVAAAQK